MNTQATDREPQLIIAGGGLVGVMAAAAAAGRGLRVLVVEKRAYLGGEITAHGQTYVGGESGDGFFRQIPPAFQGLFTARDQAGEVLAPEGRVRQQLMKILEDRNIPCLFEAEAVGLSRRGDRVGGILLACPAGLVFTPGAALLDTTDRHQVWRQASGHPFLPKGNAIIHGTFELTLPREVATLLAAPSFPTGEAEACLGLLKGSVSVHPTLRHDTLLISYGLCAPCPGDRALSRSALEARGKAKALELSKWFRDLPVDGMGKASLTHMGYECHVAMEGDGGPEDRAIHPFSLNGFATISNLPWGFALSDVAARVGEIGNVLAALAANKQVAKPTGGHTLLGRNFEVPFDPDSVEPIGDEALEVQLFPVPHDPAMTQGATFTSDVCVAGVGAAGGMAMVAASQAGASVTAVEMNRDLGGTHTIGRVTNYYHGYKGGSNTLLSDEAKEKLTPAIGAMVPGGIGHAALLHQKADQNGLRLITGSRIAAALREGNRVVGLVGANEDGLFAVNAAVCIDTTGEAELAAFSGAAYEMGDPRDGMVQTYSMWGAEVMPDNLWLAQRFLTDPDLIHPDVYSERLRAVSLGHRDNSPFHISPMITPRESRRIVGEAALSLDGVLRGSSFPQVLAVAHTPTDSHAYASSDLARIGTIASNRVIPIRIPVGCFIPKGLEGLLVGAKALSGERDATSFCRMNADVKNAGWALGWMAAASARGGMGLREVPLGPLQKELLTSGILPPWAMETENQIPASELVAKLEGQQLHTWEPILHRQASEVLPHLEKRFAETKPVSGGEPKSFTDLRSLLVLALAWHGSPAGADELSGLMFQAVSEKRHLCAPHRSSHRMHLRVASTGDDDYSLVNRLVVCAGRSPSPLVIPALAKLIGETSGPGQDPPLYTPYDSRRADIINDPFYLRLLALAEAAGRKACPELKDPMEKLLGEDGILGHDVPLGVKASPRYMRAHLEFRLVGAAAQCGSPRGLQGLARYGEDTHVFFRRHARRALGVLQGEKVILPR